MSKVSKRSIPQMPSVEEDQLITGAAKSDPDAQPLTLEQMKAMVPLKSIIGRPKSDNRNLVFQSNRRRMAVSHG